jgi:hypothetical protein
LKSFQQNRRKADSILNAEARYKEIIVTSIERIADVEMKTEMAARLQSQRIRC